MSKRICQVLAAAIAALVGTGEARAQLWDPLDTHPTPNMIVGVDTSVTMRIRSDCSDCHKQPYHPRQRMAEATADLSAVLPLFQERFAYGGYVYSGSGSAKIRRDSGRFGDSLRPRIPNPSDLGGSYQSLETMIRNLDTEGRSERRLPGGDEVSCVTPTPQCSGDGAIVNRVINGQLAPGLQLPAVSATSTTCNVPTPVAAQMDVRSELRRMIVGFDWPRYTPGALTAAEIERDFCEALEQAGNQLSATLAQCVQRPTALFDMGQFVCNSNRLVNDLCAPSSPFNGTCVCDATLPGCGGGARVSACGNPFDFKVRQQVALCAAYDEDPGTGIFGPFFRGQRDNIINAGGCRENALLLFTDGYRGSSNGVALEAPGVRQTYRSTDGSSNAYVFRVANPFRGEADALARAVNPALTEAYDATDRTTMLNSFAMITNRILQGTYSSANLAFDRFSTRVAVHAFAVPGPPYERYLGRPSRVAWHRLDDDGNIDPTPIFETDWSSKAAPGPTLRRPDGTVAGDDLFGPGGTWRNGEARSVSFGRNDLDRDGDGTNDTTVESVVWGGQLGGGRSQPVVVEGPREVPSGADAATYATFVESPAARGRPRVVYNLSNGFLHAIHAGEYRSGIADPAAARVGRLGIQRSFYYDDTVRDAGRELFRYRPSFADVPNLALNDVVQQDAIGTGQVVVREVHMTRTPAQRVPRRGSLQQGNPNDFATVLVFTQGQGGRGVAALDVTNPVPGRAGGRDPRVLWEYQLPRAQDRATNAPSVYQFPGNGPNPVVVLTGGAGGSNYIYAISIRAGAGGRPEFVNEQALPGGVDYRVAPVCLDTSGAGVVTHCYVLGGNGTLVRVPLTLSGNAVGQFGTPEDITPPGVIGGGRQFWTRPAVYFGTDNSVNLVFGSGDIERIAEGDGAQNRVFKVVDRSPVRAGGAARGTIVGACQPSGGQTNGEFVLDPGEMMISPPVVGKGVVAWTTYTPGNTGCVAGNGRLYAIDFETCADAIGAGARPAPRDIGEGLPTSPSLVRSQESIITHSSAAPTAAGAQAVAVRTRGGRRAPIKRVYWRPAVGTP